MKTAVMAVLLILTGIMWIVWVSEVTSSTSDPEYDCIPKPGLGSILFAAVFLTACSMFFAIQYGA